MMMICNVQLFTHFTENAVPCSNNLAHVQLFESLTNEVINSVNMMILDGDHLGVYVVY